MNVNVNHSIVLFDFQISTSVQPTSMNVMPMLSAITLRDLITAHAALDILEVEHRAMIIIKILSKLSSN